MIARGGVEERRGEKRSSGPLAEGGAKKATSGDGSRQDRRRQESDESSDFRCAVLALRAGNGGKRDDRHANLQTRRISLVGQILRLSLPCLGVCCTIWLVGPW